MRGWIVAVLVAGCSGKADPPAHKPLVVPTVATAAVLAAETAKPPFVVMLDESGKLAVATIAAWAELETKDIWAGARTVSVEELNRMIRERDATRTPPSLVIERSAGARGPLGGQAAQPRGDGAPSRVASVGGEVMHDGELDPLYAILLAPASLPATRIIDAVTRIDTAIAVSHAGKVRPLRIQFVVSRTPSTEDPIGWIELRVTPTDVAIEAVPDDPIELAMLEPDALAAAIDSARKRRGFAATVPVDVLVAKDVDVQRLVDVLVALDTAGVRSIGMGAVPSGEEANRRGKRVATLSIGVPSIQGNISRDEVSTLVENSRGKMLACYEAALVKTPNLAGTMELQFFIAPNGVAISASASGLDTGVQNCITEVIRTLQLPKPVGGGGAQVMYPFTFRT